MTVWVVCMDSPTAIFLTQLPIAISIFWGVYEMYRFRKELIPRLDKLLKR